MIKRFLAWLNQPALSAYKYLIYFDGESYLIKIPAFPLLRLAASSFESAVELAEASIKSQLKKQITAKPVGVVDTDDCYVGVFYAAN